MRRRAMLLGAGGVLSGCGFRPLYMPEGGQGSPASLELAAVYIPVIPERTGQLLRQALQRRMEGAGDSGVAKKYDLITAMVAIGEGTGIQRDTSTTRIRLVGTAPWSLRVLNLQHTVLKTGSARVLDGYNILNQQFFAAELESESAYRRMAESLADQIVAQVAVFLRDRTTASPASAPPAAPAPAAPAVLPPASAL